MGDPGADREKDHLRERRDPKVMVPESLEVSGLVLAAGDAIVEKSWG